MKSAQSWTKRKVKSLKSLVKQEKKSDEKLEPVPESAMPVPESAMPMPAEDVSPKEDVEPEFPTQERMTPEMPEGENYNGEEQWC